MPKSLPKYFYLFRISRLRVKKAEKAILDLDVRTKNVPEMENALAELKRDAAPAPEKDRQLAVFFVSLLFLGELTAGFVYHYAHPHDIEFLFDFASYALPALGAVIAGLGVFLRNERRWFWVAGIFVLLGFITFVVSKGSYKSVAFVFIVVYGIICSLALVPTYIWRTRMEANTGRYKLKLLGIYAFCVIGYLCGIFLCAVVVPRYLIPGVQHKHYSCMEKGKYKDTGRLYFDCYPVNDESDIDNNKDGRSDVKPHG